MRLKELLDFNDVVIQCHDNPDSDALASGYALWWYFRKMGKDVRFIYRGINQIRKSNLVIMLEELKVPVTYEPLFSDKPQLLVMVDCQYGQRNVTETDAGNIAVIDHHQTTTSLPHLSEVRSRIGSCSTIVWDMIRAEGLELKGEPLISTALYYGLYTDTNRLSEISHPLDRDMLDDLTILGSIITKMNNSNISLSELRITGKAILGYDYYEDDHYLILQAEPCDPNILGVISDFSLETDAVDVCVAFYAKSEEIKFSVRSCIKEVHADELAQYLAQGYGGGGGHINKAGGTIRTELLPETGDGLPQTANRVFRERLAAYFDRYEIIYAEKTVLGMEDMKRYDKLPQELGTVKLTEVFPTGTTVWIRTLEGDISVRIRDDMYLMIGIEGEIYPIEEEKLRKSYEMLNRPDRRQFDYMPGIKNAQTDERKEVMAYAQAIRSMGTVSIYARPLKGYVKLFTKWDKERYYSGEPGDYLAFRVDDEHDIYVIRGELFDKLYRES